MKKKKYLLDGINKGMRLTDCCAAVSTFEVGSIDADGTIHDQLICTKCFKDVELGEGDGSEWAPGTFDDDDTACV